MSLPRPEAGEWFPDREYYTVSVLDLGLRPLQRARLSQLRRQSRAGDWSPYLVAGARRRGGVGESGPEALGGWQPSWGDRSGRLRVLKSLGSIRRCGTGSTMRDPSTASGLGSPAAHIDGHVHRWAMQNY